MNSTKNIISILKQTLISYIKNLKEDGIISIGNSIVSNYLQSKFQLHKKLLNKILLIYSKKELIILKQYLNKWRSKFKFNTIYQKIYNYKKNNLTRNNSFSKKNIFQKNWSDKNYTITKKQKQKFIYNSLNTSLVTHSETIANFIQRQEEYLKESNNLMNKMKKNSEKECGIIYTFIPKVNDNLRNLYKKSKISAYSRLYNDSIERKNKRKESEKKVNVRLLKNKRVNKNYFDELYEDYKIREKKNKILMKKIDFERGYTFIPNLIYRNQNFDISFDNYKRVLKRKKNITPEIKGNNTINYYKKNKLKDISMISKGNNSSVISN